MIFFLSVMISPLEKYAELKLIIISKKNKQPDKYDKLLNPENVEYETFSGIMKKFSKNKMNIRIFQVILKCEFG